WRLSNSSTAAFTSAMSEEARVRADSAAAVSMPRLRALRRCSERATRSGASPSETGASTESRRRASVSSSCARRRSTSSLKPLMRLLTYDSMSARKLFSKSPLLDTFGSLLCRLGFRVRASRFEALQERLLRGAHGVRRALWAWPSGPPSEPYGRARGGTSDYGRRAGTVSRDFFPARFRFAIFV